MSTITGVVGFDEGGELLGVTRYSLLGDRTAARGGDKGGWFGGGWVGVMPGIFLDINWVLGGRAFSLGWTQETFSGWWVGKAFL